MRIVLKSKDRFIKPLIKKKQSPSLSILEGVQLISELETFSSKEERESQLDIQIIENRTVLLKDQINLGYGEGTHYLSYLNHRVKNVHQVKGIPIPPDIQSVLTRLEALYQAELKQSLVIEPTQLDEAIPSEAIQNIQSQQEDIDVNNQVEKAIEQTVPPEPIEIAESPSNLARSIKKYSTFFLGIFGSLILGGFIFNQIAVPTSPTEIVKITESTTVSLTTVTEEEETTELLSLETLLEEKRFEDALLFYPQEFPLIERSIFYLGQDGIPHLEKFLQEKDYPKGQFDLFYLKKEFQSVIDLKEYADTDERKAQLIIAYLQLGMYPEAETLNQVLNNEVLQVQINQQKELVMINLIKENQLDEVRQLQESFQSAVIQQYLDHYDQKKSELDQTNEQLANEDLSEENKKQLETYKQELEAYLVQLKDNLKME